jgi:hypothetical protein
MKRLLVLALLAVGLTIVVVPTAVPAPGSDAKGPPCSNITNGDLGYSLAGVIDATVFLQAPACSFVNYSFSVTDTDGNAIASLSPDAQICTPETPDGGCVHFSANLGDSGPQTICVSAATDIQGQHFADLAPNSFDASCPPSSPSTSLVKGGSGAAGGFN